MSTPEFTPTSLTLAITTLFESNNYNVDGPIQVHGAEVDLRAISKSDPFAPPIYIEATIEYVDNEKYGKDATKFVLLREVEPNATLLCISAVGFSLPVKERAKHSRIEALTYQELFGRFERFGGYLDTVLSNGDLARELLALDTIYEEARFRDKLGDDSATAFLSEWRLLEAPTNPWIVVVGDYGTGKTALTKVLLRRWMMDYEKNPNSPIPFRIELKDFTRQFDARGLLHHFLDTNGLPHLPVDFVTSLIKQGRVVLILDGYDEMAQYMHARERRECLAALAELAKDGAKGILTSRPNYFTEAEELRLLDALYTSLDAENKLTRVGKAFLEKEKALDKLLQTQFLERYERFLQDLDAEQTRSLVQRALVSDAEGQAAVLRILDVTFRTTDEGAAVSLSGKPVIISYLLDVVEELKAVDVPKPESGNQNSLTEWDVYSLIVDKLMWRDYRRAPEIFPNERLLFLQRLSVDLSATQQGTIQEPAFMELIKKEFHNRLRQLPQELRRNEVEKLFADLRSSATLTRRTDTQGAGWRFSHNSLREFLVSQYLTRCLIERLGVRRIRISDAMRLFVVALGEVDRNQLLNAFKELANSDTAGEVVGMYLELTWDAFIRLFSAQADPVSTFLTHSTGTPIKLNDITVNRVDFSQRQKRTNLERAKFVNASLTDIDFNSCDLAASDFDSCLLEGVSFKGADLTNSNFSNAILIEVDFTDAKLKGANFRSLADHSGIRTATGLHSGEAALGYIAFSGGKTDKISPIAICKHHPNHAIAEKIARKLTEQNARQKRGLTQRGAANKDPKTAKDFLHQLISKGLVEEMGGRSGLVRSTEEGRPILKAFCDNQRLDPSLYEFFDFEESKYR